MPETDKGWRIGELLLAASSEFVAFDVFAVVAVFAVFGAFGVFGECLWNESFGKARGARRRLITLPDRNIERIDIRSGMTFQEFRREPFATCQ